MATWTWDNEAWRRCWAFRLASMLAVAEGRDDGIAAHPDSLPLARRILSAAANGSAVRLLQRYSPELYADTSSSPAAPGIVLFAETYQPRCPTDFTRRSGTEAAVVDLGGVTERRPAAAAAVMTAVAQSNGRRSNADTGEDAAAPNAKKKKAKQKRSQSSNSGFGT